MTEELEALTNIAGNITGTAVLLYGLWAIITGKLKTEGHHKEVVDQHVKSEERAWETVEKLTEARSLDNAIMEKFSESLRDLRASVDTLRSTIDNQRPRR